MKFEVRFFLNNSVVINYDLSQSADCWATAAAPGSSLVAAIAYSCMVSALRIPADLLMKLTSTSDLVWPSSSGTTLSFALAPLAPLDPASFTGFLVSRSEDSSESSAAALRLPARLPAYRYFSGLEICFLPSLRVLLSRSLPLSRYLLSPGWLPNRLPELDLCLLSLSLEFRRSELVRCWNL